MIAQLRGVARRVSDTQGIIDCRGVGYRVRWTKHTAELAAEGTHVEVDVHQVITEHSHELYGFIVPGEIELFLDLIKCKRIGATTAIRAMSSAGSPMHVRALIADGDIGGLSKLKGLGPKGAETVVKKLGGR